MSRAELAQLVGFAGFGLALAAVAAAVASFATGRRAWLATVALAAAAMTTGLHVRGIPLGGYLRGMMGDLSITTSLMLAAALARTITGRTALDERARAALSGWTVAASVVLYPLTLGLTRFDPYELGYRPRALLVLVAALVVWWWRSRRGAAVVLVASVAAFDLRVIESVNLWDYLLDPALALWSAGALAWRAAGPAMRTALSRLRRA